MFRCAVAASRIFRPLVSLNATRILPKVLPFSPSISSGSVPLSTLTALQNSRLIDKKPLLDICNKIAPIQVRTVIKFSLKKGKRKTVKAALRRFYRLDWGGWIRPKVGRKKKLWKKSLAQKRRLRQHVFCNATQSTMLDKMVTKFWKRPKYYVENPYAPYHTREEFYNTRRKPLLRE